MKKLLSVLLCVTASTVFIACQKTHDLPATEMQGAELMTTTTGEVAMESAASDCGQFRTQSQGGWGANPAGENPGTYLHDHFGSAFPNGLVIGCTSKFTVSFTSASSITEFLPAGGTAMALTGNASDPLAKSIKNVLIGQVAALALNIGFDYNDPNFGPANENLGNMVIASGQFSGLSVIQFLGVANDVLGGCNTQISADSVNQTASMINANFLDGTNDGGFLTCPTERGPER